LQANLGKGLFWIFEFNYKASAAWMAYSNDHPKPGKLMELVVLRRMGWRCWIYNDR